MRHLCKTLAVSALLLLSASASAVRPGQDAPVEIEGWDLSVLDAKIAEAAAKAGDSRASRQDKIAAAAAYLARANFFYNAGQPPFYKLAVGDFRRALRLHPDNVEAREKLHEIVSIYESMRRPVPTHGNEQDIYNDPRVRYKLKPKPVAFQPGRKTLTLSNEIPTDVAYVYELKGDAGQQVFMKMEAGRAAASFGVCQGQVEGATPVASDVTEWAGVIPGDGSYLIKVKSRRGPAAYRLEVITR